MLCNRCGHFHQLPGSPNHPSCAITHFPRKVSWRTHVFGISAPLALDLYAHSPVSHISGFWVLAVAVSWGPIFSHTSHASGAGQHVGSTTKKMFRTPFPFSPFRLSSCGKCVRRYFGLQSSVLSSVHEAQHASPNVLRLFRVKRGHLSRDGKTTRFRYLPAQKESLATSLSRASPLCCARRRWRTGPVVYLECLSRFFGTYTFHRKDIVTIR
ncbi:hypothetical protein BC826DRAFT_637053 [Russula brevipes]|nr:hypothetical protein BC826DRAFT_637053 [Russula brevipes]